jgi:hypothetical protein
MANHCCSKLAKSGNNLWWLSDCSKFLLVVQEEGMHFLLVDEFVWKRICTSWYGTVSLELADTIG